MIAVRGGPGGNVWAKRLTAAAYWTLPSLFCLLIYSRGLVSWFQQDDFSWLALRMEWHGPGDLPFLLFGPRAQGTVRFLADRSFFLLFSSLFGFNPLPYHAAVFATQAANLALLSSVARRLTRSRAAGFIAPLLWVANDALAVPLSWLSAYNQILCCFFILLAFYFLLRYIEEGKPIFLCLQWGVFLLGFGALEINVVYPALATGYVLLCAREHLRKTLPLFIPSILFVALHWFLIPKPATGAYARYFDSGMMQTFGVYWQWALGPGRLGLITPVRSWFAPAGTALLTLALLGFTVARLRKADRVPVFALLWFLATLAPVMPLRDHIENYYLTLPSAGLALLGAWAVVRAWNANWPARGTALALTALYAATSIPVGFIVADWHLVHGRQAKNLVLSVAEAHEKHPGKTILLQGVDEELFWAAIFDNPFRLFGISQVHLAPGEAVPEQGGHWRSPSEFVYDPRTTVCDLRQGRAVVYEVMTVGLRDVTRDYYSAAIQRWGPCPAG